jgi:hypothetical protein
VLHPVYTSRIGISRAKKNDLLSLLRSKIIPDHYTDFYVNLPVNLAEKDRLPEPSMDEVELENADNITDEVDADVGPSAPANQVNTVISPEDAGHRTSRSDTAYQIIGQHDNNENISSITTSRSRPSRKSDGTPSSSHVQPPCPSSSGRKAKQQNTTPSSRRPILVLYTNSLAN